MEIRLGNRLKHAFNAFMNRDPTYKSIGGWYGYRQDKIRLSTGTERSIITSIYNRISVDVASNEISHVKVDDENRFKSLMKSSLNDCLHVEANIDQTGRSFIQDAVLSMLDEGVVALVPIDTDFDPKDTSFKINSLRTGKIIEWYANAVRVRAYNELTGRQEEIIVPKKTTAIIENPFYSVMNAPNSTMQRLIRKLNLLDAIDEQSGSGKMDLIIQLPYSVKTDLKRERANARKADIEDQLMNSKYGIAYIDSTERVTQLNRSVDNNLMSQIEYLTKMVYSQIGITQSILDGTANEDTMNNYYVRICKPILTVLVEEMKRKFLTKTARTQGQSILFFRDPFELIPVSKIANISDSLTRNEIISTNEVRQSLGKKPSDDPNADKLKNKNIKKESTEVAPQTEQEQIDDNTEENQNE